MFELNEKNYAKAARQAVAEGCVLLKNEGGVLPLVKGTKTAVFGIGAFYYYKGGLGSGGLVNTKYVVSILDALRKSEDISVDECICEECEKMDTSQYLDLFIDETKEHLQSLNEHVLVLEKEPENEDTINEIFRAAHTLKGMSGTMGFVRMQRLTHDLENVFSEIRNGNMKVNEKLIDVLFRGLDALESYLAVISSEGNEGTEDNEDIINDLNALLEEQSGDGAAAPAQKEVKKEETPAKEEKAENKQESASDEKCKFKQIPISEYEATAINSARAEEKNNK